MLLHIGKKSVHEKNFHFLERIESLYYSPSEDASYCLSSVLFAHDVPSEAFWVKSLFLQPFRGPTFELTVKAKGRNLILHMDLYKGFIFQHGRNLKLFFCKSKA